MNTSHKIISLSQCIQRLNAWRLLGEKIVFTNGCFDLLHIGHISYLEQARSLGNRLVVGLNSDNSVRQLKGENRPIFAEGARAKVLAALECIDAVMIFEEKTADNLLQNLQPDYYTKGGDYVIETLPEYKSVKNYGGEIVILPFIEGFSSSQTLAKIAHL